MIQKQHLRAVFVYMAEPERCPASLRDREAGSRKGLRDGVNLIRDDTKVKLDDTKMKFAVNCEIAPFSSRATMC